MEYIVSKEFNKGDNVNGRIAYDDLQDCFNDLKPGDIVYLKNEQYYGKLVLKCSDITLIGSDESIITYDSYNSMIVRECDGGDGVKTYGTTGSTTFMVAPSAINFRMSNVIVENSHKHENKVVSGDQAVAFKTEADNGFYEDCKFIGCQDTLYIAGCENVFNKCYISGTVDFIFGPGTAILDNCTIIIRSNENYLNYICAPNTKEAYLYGLFFYKCKISAEKGDGKMWLGRPWFDTGKAWPILPKALFYKCTLPDDLILEFIKMSKGDMNYHEMFYYDCIIKGEHVSSDIDPRIIDLYEKIYLQRR